MFSFLFFFFIFDFGIPEVVSVLAMNVLVIIIQQSRPGSGGFDNSIDKLSAKVC